MATGRIGTTPVLQVRWSKAPSAGTTSLSGLDDNSVSLVYSVGYEAVYRNGVLLSRTNDYTATDGTTITLIDATIAGDIIEVFANQTIPLTDTYSQTVSDGRFIKNTLTTTTGDIIYASAANTPARLGIGSTSQVLTVSGGIPAWAAPASGGMTLISTTTMSGASVTLSSIPQDYVSLLLVGRSFTNSTADGVLRINPNGDGGIARISGVIASGTFSSTTNILQLPANYDRTNDDNSFQLQIFNYQDTANYTMPFIWSGNFYAGAVGLMAGGILTANAGPLTSLVISNTGGNWAGGTLKFYGVK